MADGKKNIPDAGKVGKHPEPGKGTPIKEEAPAAPEPEQPPATRDADRGVKEEIVYLNLSELHPFKNHPFGVRDDAEMQGLVESVKAAGVNQPALVRLVRAADMRSSPDTAASGPADWPGFPKCPSGMSRNRGRTPDGSRCCGWS